MDKNLDILTHGILSGDRTSLSRGITLIESRKESDRNKAFKLLNSILPHTGKSKRIGITGAPGVGKSTFIDSFGHYLTQNGHKVAVLAIDPTSGVTGGSILGDKTRMEKLIGNPRAFVRPSPSSGELGGVGRRTFEAALLCEAAGYDTILIETVGVGQSEVVVREMTDLVIFVTIPATGDDLQGIKRGIMETIDLIVINKADLFDAKEISRLKENLRYALHLFPARESGYSTKIKTISASEAKGMTEVYEAANEFILAGKSRGYFEENRENQKITWMKRIFRGLVFEKIDQNETYQNALKHYEKSVLANEITPTEAALKIYQELIKN